jgi:hypothetical protein
MYNANPIVHQRPQGDNALWLWLRLGTLVNEPANP